MFSFNVLLLVGTLVCLFAAPSSNMIVREASKLDTDGPVESNVTSARTLPKLIPTFPSSKSRETLTKRFGTKILQQIESFRSTWFKLDAEKPTFVPTVNQMVWFSALVNVPTTRGRRKRSFSTRKEYRQLTCQQRNRFHSAVKALKTSLIDGVSQYDIFVQFHHPSMAPAAHGGAGKSYSKYSLSYKSHCSCLSCIVFDNIYSFIIMINEDFSGLFSVS